VLGMRGEHVIYSRRTTFKASYADVIQGQHDTVIDGLKLIIEGAEEILQNMA